MIGGHSLKASKESSEPNGMPTVDRARFVQRVEGAMKAAQQRDGKIQVRLSPPDLGSIKIELAVQNGVLSAKLEAETPAARNLLLDSLPALRERLAQQDIRVDKFDVDVRREGSNNGNGQPDERAANQSGERQPGRNRPAAVRAPGNATVSLRSSAATTSSAAGLDVRV
jgi:flagellar hook-length control protein FliK